jgi:hypothetical protein
MSTVLHPLRPVTILQVTKAPHTLFRFHWHELFPIARIENGPGSVTVYLPEVEPGNGRRELVARLRESLAGRTLEETSPVVVDGYLVQVLDDRLGLLPDFDPARLDALVAGLAPGEMETVP